MRIIHEMKCVLYWRSYSEKKVKSRIVFIYIEVRIWFYIEVRICNNTIEVRIWFYIEVQICNNIVEVRIYQVHEHEHYMFVKYVSFQR